MPADSAATLEVTSCPLCGSKRAASTPYAQAPYAVRRCQECSLWYLSPRPRAELASASYESDDYFSGGDSGYDDYAAQERSLRRGFRAILNRLRRRGLTGGRLLEAGSGLGYFLDEARDFFNERSGIELAPHAARAAAALSDATIHNSLDEVPEAARFDLIFASHVIEHIYEPVTFTRTLLAHLAPGGVIVFSTPNMNSFWRKLMGRRWPSFKYPEHVTFFDKNTLRRLFQSAGATDVRPLPILDRFPVSEVLAKLQLPVPGVATRLDLPLPATSVCAMARAPRAETE